MTELNKVVRLPEILLDGKSILEIVFCHADVVLGFDPNLNFACFHISFGCRPPDF